MEHRCGTRYPVNIPVHVRSQGSTLPSTGRLMSISVSGGFLEIAPGVPTLARVSMRIVEAGGALGMRWEGHVVRKTARGLGIEWEGDISSLLQSLTEPRYADSPARIEPRHSAGRHDRPK